jgi:probable rRNA maturation factor
LDSHTEGTIRAIAGRLDPPDRGVDLIIVDDRRIRLINRDFRGSDRPTDVISFSYLGDEPASDEDTGGEVYVSWETVTRDAAAMGVATEHLFLRIGVHGLLHVVGFDHEDDASAQRMEREERRLLAEHLGDAVETLF